MTTGLGRRWRRLSNAELPFRLVVRTATWGAHGNPAPADIGSAMAARIGWAVRAAGRRACWRARCFHRGLAAQWMLRRRGIVATLYSGVAPDREKGLVAHVWVRTAEFDVGGGESANRFPVLATIPPNFAEHNAIRRTADAAT
jgi:Transglutaminase-like superfamily